MDVYARRSLIDRVARWAITLGGVTIIVSILLMLVFLVGEVLPLWQSPSVEEEASIPMAEGNAPSVLAVNSYRELLFAVRRDGVARVLDTVNGADALVDTLTAFVGDPITASAPMDPDGLLWLVGTASGRVVPIRLVEGVSFSGSGRSYSPEVLTSAPAEVGATGPVRAVAARADDDGGFVAAVLDRDGVVHTITRSVRRSITGGERISDSTGRVDVDAPHVVSAMAFGADGRLFLGTEQGALIELEVDAPGAQQTLHTVFTDAGITALGALLGGQSLVVGSSDGQVEVWFRALVGDEGVEKLELIPAHTFARHEAAVVGVSPSSRDKSFLTFDAEGGIHVSFSTTQALIASFRIDGGELQIAGLAPKGDGVVAADRAGRVHRWSLEAHHPEATFGALFGKVHYEGYAEPEYVWQSTGATDETEPKMSLVPLIFGTLKGTFYALFVSVPIGILAALYSALFMRADIRNVVKPAMELMAAIPSVVLGLLAGLWLAPRLETAMPTALLAPAIVVAVVVLGGAAWRRLPARVRRIGPQGIEAFVLIPVLLGGVAALLAFNGPISAGFEGGFLGWLYTNFDVRYDQRNALVVGLAMGLAVIPIIFSISEDAISSVPRHLTAGSLALGATPWQTAWRVVLPAASPGIFSAVMIGFGRAVGETMIVLMATGNTPIMDWSAFNGFRTLSANIAVEIPEAPHGESLYRVLFFAALLLFMITFLVNTVAEIVRHRLRQRYSRF